MYASGSHDQKAVGMFVTRSLTSLLANIRQNNPPENVHREILQMIRALSLNRETYYMADLLFAVTVTGISVSTSNIFSILQLGSSAHPSLIFQNFFASLSNEDFFRIRNINLLKCSSWQAIVLNLNKYVSMYMRDWTMADFKHDFLGVFITSRDRKTSAIKNTWNIINNFFGNLPNVDEQHALTMFVVAHCSLAYNFFLSRGQILNIARQISESDRIPVIAVSILPRLKKAIADIRISQNTDKLEKIILNSYLGINCLPAHIPSNPNQLVLDEEVFKPLELKLAVSNMAAPRQFHLDSYPSANVRSGPDDARTRDPQRYQRYKLAYESHAAYQQWFIVVYKDYAQPGTRLPTYNSVLQSFPDLIFFYGAKCLQRVSHGHAIIITRNPLTTDLVQGASSILFGTRDILVSPLHGDTIGQAMDYIRLQATETPTEYNPGLLTKNIPVFKSAQALEHGFYNPGRKIFRMVSMGMAAYEARPYIQRDMVNPIVGLRSRYAEFWNRYRRVILARFNTLRNFYRYPQVAIIRLPLAEYFDEADRWCDEHHMKAYIIEVQNGQLQFHSYLCEPVIIIQDRDNNPNNLQNILEMLKLREGPFINLEAVICRNYEGDPRILSTSSDDEVHPTPPNSRQPEEEDYSDSIINTPQPTNVYPPGFSGTHWSDMSE